MHSSVALIRRPGYLIMFMADENKISYPNIKQSWGIVGISILAMILLVPVSLLLENLAGRELSFLVYYIMAMGATFWIAHWKRKKWTNISVYNFEFSSAKIIILVSITVVAIQTGVISPLVSL